MFPGYSRSPDNSKSSYESSSIPISFPTNQLYVDSDGEVLTQQQKREKDIMAKQKLNRQFLEKTKKENEEKESQAIRKIGAGISDSSEDDDPILIKSCAGKQKSNPSRRMLQIQETYGASHKKIYSEKNEYERSESSSSQRKTEKRKHSRSRSKSKKHKNKRSNKRHRRSSSSSTSSICTLPNRSKNEIKKSENKFNTQKWEFITDNELLALSRSFTWIVNSTNFDHDNYNMGLPKREKSYYRYNIRAIDGFGDSNTFKEMYAEELAKYSQPKKKREKKFWEKLLSIAKHPPQETKFRKKLSILDTESGFYPLSVEPFEIFEYEHERREKEEQRKKIENELGTISDKVIDESIINEIADLDVRGQTINIKLEKEPNNIKLWIQFLDLQDEIYNAKKIYDNNQKAHFERKEAILKKATSTNPREVIFKIMMVDLMIEMNKSTENILNEFTQMAHSFPHEPQVWIRYLDYVQYTASAYSFGRMNKAYSLCLEKVQGLVEGTLQSHVRFIKNVQEFSNFYLFIYIRYLKWLIGAGYVPLAVANIQATFELNCGFTSIISKSQKERMNKLRNFWETKMPRIGDSEAQGAENELIRFEKNGEKLARDLEDYDYELMLEETRKAVKTHLERDDRPIAKNWVEFERRMMNIDARVKRNNKEWYDAEYKVDTDVLELWDAIDSYSIKVYVHSTSQSKISFVQPLLELLGAKFITTTESWNTTEELVETWSNDGNIRFDNKLIFERVPTYSEEFCRELALNIIEFLIKKSFHQEELNDFSHSLIAASVLTTAIKIERKMEQPMWKMSVKLLEDFKGKVLAHCKTTIESNKFVENVSNLVAIQKFIEWHQKARQNMVDIEEEIKACQRRNQVTTLYLDKDDEKRIFKRIPIKILKWLQECAPVLTSSQSEPTYFADKSKLCEVQCHLFGTFLRVQIAPVNDKKAIEMCIITQTLEIEPDKISFEEVRVKLFELYKKLFEREKIERETGVKTSISILPSASTIVYAMSLYYEFVNLKVGLNDQETMKRLTSDVITTAATANRDDPIISRDLKLLIDTLLMFYSENHNRKILYYPFYKILFGSAQGYFPRDVRYIKRYVEEYATCGVKKIQLMKSLDMCKREIWKYRRERFDVNKETEKVMIALAIMYCSLRVTSNVENCGLSLKSLLKVFIEQANYTNDPALWRLAIKLAATIENENYRSLNDTHILAMGQCPWSRNIYIDRVEGEPTEDVLNKMMMLVIEKGGEKNKKEGGSPHDLFIEDIGVLEVYVESAKERTNEQ